MGGWFSLDMSLACKVAIKMLSVSGRKWFKAGIKYVSESVMWRERLQHVRTIFLYSWNCSWIPEVFFYGRKINILLLFRILFCLIESYSIKHCIWHCLGGYLGFFLLQKHNTFQRYKLDADRLS